MSGIAEAVCHGLGRGRKRDFIFARYECDEHGEWTAELPATGPCGSGDDCRIREHDSRARRTGPGYPLVVIACAVHRRYFTLYPPGYVPYGRKCLISEDKGDKETVFAAAFDAADGSERWSEIGTDGRWWSTQWRQVKRTGELLGLGGDGQLSERAAVHLGISLHVHAEACCQYSQKSFRQRGRAVVKVIQAVIAAGLGVLWRLLRAGHASGCLGRGLYAAAGQRLMVVSPF